MTILTHVKITLAMPSRVKVIFETNIAGYRVYCVVY